MKKTTAQKTKLATLRQTVSASRTFVYTTSAGNQRAVRKGDRLTVTDTLGREWRSWDSGAREIVAINGKRLSHFAYVFGYQYNGAV